MLKAKRPDITLYIYDSNGKILIDGDGDGKTKLSGVHVLKDSNGFYKRIDYKSAHKTVLVSRLNKTADFSEIISSLKDLHDDIYKEIFPKLDHRRHSCKDFMTLKQSLADHHNSFIVDLLLTLKHTISTERLGDHAPKIDDFLKSLSVDFSQELSPSEFELLVNSPQNLLKNISLNLILFSSSKFLASFLDEPLLSQIFYFPIPLILDKIGMFFPEEKLIMPSLILLESIKHHISLDKLMYMFSDYCDSNSVLQSLILDYCFYRC